VNCGQRSFRDCRKGVIGIFIRFGTFRGYGPGGELVNQWAPIMNGIEKLRSNIETLKDSLAEDWSDLASSLSNEQRNDIENHLEWCLAEMGWCLAEMKKLSARLRIPNPI
jgi:hypothetical protein